MATRTRDVVGGRLISMTSHLAFLCIIRYVSVQVLQKQTCRDAAPTQLKSASGRAAPMAVPYKRLPISDVVNAAAAVIGLIASPLLQPAWMLLK